MQAHGGFQATGYDKNPCAIIISRICKQLIQNQVPNTMLSDILFINKYDVI